MNRQDVNKSIIQNLIFISPSTSPSAAYGKASEARPWLESPTGEHLPQSSSTLRPSPSPSPPRLSPW